eukprot:5036807-Alexandrium_andersonii.AAC.1
MPPRASKAPEAKSRGRSRSRPAMATRQPRGAIAGYVPRRRRQPVTFLLAGGGGIVSKWGHVCLRARGR